MMNKIHNMDCLEGLSLLPDNSIDLTVTSPPYDNLRNYEGFTFDFNGIARELYRVTKDGGVVVWVVGDKTVSGSETGTSFRQALYFKKIGFNLHDTMIYQKDSLPYPETNRYYPSFEYMFIFSKGKPSTTNLIADKPNKWFGQNVTGTTRNVDGSLSQHSAVKNKTNRKIREFGVRTNIWTIKTGKNKSTLDKIAYEHPAIFPEKLAEDHIITWSNENDIVLDPFMGSGTTAKMAILNNRKYIGFEVSEKYCEIANKRIEDVNNIMLQIELEMEEKR